MKEKNFNQVSNQDIDILNVEATKAAIEEGNELSDSEKINAYLAIHAVEHYAAALSLDEEETTDVEDILNACKKEEEVYWLYTCPVLATSVKKTDAKGKALPTQEDWEKANKGAVRVEELAGKMWYKRAFTIGDARGVRSVVNGFNNWQDARANAQKKVDNTLAAAAAILGVTVEELKALKGIK